MMATRCLIMATIGGEHYDIIIIHADDGDERKKNQNRTVFSVKKKKL